MVNTNFDYYDGTNMQNIQFYMLPKVLMDNRKFDNISVESKVLYSMMLDRARLSKQNNWLDEMGRIYIYFTVDNIQIALKCSKGKALKMLKELDMGSGVGLIERKKGKGMGKADIIYVKTCICKEDIKQAKVINSDCGKDVDKPVDKIVVEVAEPITDTKIEPLVVQKTNHFGTKIEPQVVQNLYPNNNKLINNKNSDTNSIQINSIKKEMELKGIENNSKSILEIQEEVLADFKAEQTLPYIYTDVAYHRHLKQGIKFLSEYDYYKKSTTNENLTLDERCQCDEYFSLVHIFSEALFKMLSTNGNQNINGRNITYSKVYDELVNYVEHTTLIDGYTDERTTKLLVRELLHSAIGNYKIASKINRIKYPIPYMITCIWTAMENGEARVFDAIRHDFQDCGLGVM